MHDISIEDVESLRNSARMMVRELGLLKDAYYDIGVTLAERHLLIELDQLIFPNVKEVAEILLLDKSSASRLISKAVKKGFVTYLYDKNDKRQKLLQITEHGKQTLAAIEPLAQKQVLNALKTLTKKEAQTVYEGMALFANGLKMARTAKVMSLDEIEEKIKKLGYSFGKFKPEDKEDLYLIFQKVVDAGLQFPYKSNSMEEFNLRFFGPQSQVYVCRADKAIACFYLRTNSEGVANAAYMIDESARGKGLGRLMVEASLQLAKKLGYHSMQYNMVYSKNTVAVNLYKRLGFRITKTIVGLDGDQTAYIMLKEEL